MSVMLKIVSEYFRDLWNLLFYILGWIIEGRAYLGAYLT